MVAAGTATLAVLLTVMEFFIYKEFVDFLFPSKKGRNVWGTIEPAGEVKQQIILSAHHDSAHIFNFLEKDPSSYVRKVLTGTLSQWVMLLFTWYLVIAASLGWDNAIVYWVLTGILLVASLGVAPLWFFANPKGTPGAGDNMICTALAMEVGKHFAREKTAGNPLAHTRVVVASWDAEECGLRGARAYVRRHLQDLQNTKTYNLNFECMYDHRALHFLTSDLNNFVPLSTGMTQDGVRLSRDLGFEARTAPFPFLAGGTDAAEFAKAGVEATTLVGMDWETRKDNSAYHTTRDTIEAVDEEAVRRSIALSIQFVLEKDQEL